MNEYKPMHLKDYLKDLLSEGFLDHFNPEMNSTLPYYPMLMYSFIYALGLQNILEVGTLHGYSSYYLARAAKVNGGHFYGIDIDEEFCKEVRNGLDKFNLPNTIICADTKKMDKIDFADRIDFAFLDGEHTTEAVQHEIELIYPLLNKKGWGYVFIHDVLDMGNADIWWKLTQDKRFEHMMLYPNYGLGILRAIEGMEDYESVARRLGKLKS